MKAEWALVWLLRLTGGAMLCALIFVFCPFDWMVAIHRQLGLGELAYTPLLSYLTRTLSAMYASMGALLLVMSFEVHRYLPVIRFLGVLGLIGGVGVTILDATAGLPRLWAMSEGPFVIVLSAVLLALARPRPSVLS